MLTQIYMLNTVRKSKTGKKIFDLRGGIFQKDLWFVLLTVLTFISYYDIKN